MSELRDAVDGLGEKREDPDNRKVFMGDGTRRDRYDPEIVLQLHEWQAILDLVEAADDYGEDYRPPLSSRPGYEKARARVMELAGGVMGERKTVDE